MKTKIVLIFVIIFACAKLADAQYAKLFDFKGEPSLKSPYYSQPVYDGTYLYDMTSAGGNNNMGAVYRVKPDGSNFMILLDFNGTNGSTPTGSLIISGNTLLGMTSLGGISDMGCVFKISTNGTGYTKLLDFSGTVNGSTPFGSLTLSGSYLFGMTYRGGAYSAGCILR